VHLLAGVLTQLKFGRENILRQLETFHPVEVIINDFNKKHPISELELNVLWVDIVNLFGRVLYSPQTLADRIAVRMQVLSIEVFLHELFPKF
jgi:hypothetical protein